MENIYVDSKIDIEDIRHILSSLFPDLKFFCYNFYEDEPEGLDLNNPDHVVFNTIEDTHRKEFGFNISIYKMPDLGQSERALYIGQKISEKLNQRVLVPFSLPESPNDPYYDIIFDQGKVYLADDCDTSFADNAEGLVQILGEYQLPQYKFSSKGQLEE